MAKLKGSKFSKVLKDIRSSNEQLREKELQSGVVISELRKDVSSLENTVLLIMEKMRRMEKYPVVQTKKGKLIPPKVGADTTILPANDSNLNDDINNDTSKNILLKMYNFMVRNAENQKVKDNNERKQKQSIEKRKEVNYRKELIKAGLDPKLFKKKKGLLGKIGTGVKFGSFIAIGTGLAGLIWIFKEEIVSVSKSIGESVREFGEFISQKIQTIVDIIQPILNFVKDNPIFQTIQEKIDKITGQIQDNGGSILNTVISEVQNMITGVYDSITGWLMDSFSPVAKFLSDPKITWEQFKAVLTSVAFAIAGGPARKLAISAGSIETAVDNAESIRLKSVYGEEYYNRTKDIVDKFSDEDLEKLFKQEFGGRYKDFFVGKLDRRELTNAIVRDHLEQALMKPIRDDRTGYYGKEDPKQKRRLEVLSKLNERDNKFLQDLQKIADDLFPNQGYKADRYDSKDEKTGEVTSGFAILRPDGTPVINLDTDYMEMLRQKGKLAIKEYIKNELIKADEFVQDTSLYKAGKETVEQGKDLYEQSKVKTEQLSKDVKSQIGSVVSATRETYSGVSTPTDAVFTTGNVISAGASKVGEKITPLLQKTSKISSEDLFNFANKSYEQTSNAISSVGEVMSQFSDWDKATAFMNKLTPEQRSVEIKQDPNEDPFNLQAMFDRSKESVAPVNKVINNKGSTSTTDNFAFPPVRNNDPSKRWCVIDSICKP